jgi:hypothetical protein
MAASFRNQARSLNHWDKILNVANGFRFGWIHHGRDFLCAIVEEENIIIGKGVKTFDLHARLLG